MSEPAPGHIDPVTRSLPIQSTDRVATMGSCFAQHLSRYVQRAGYHFFVTETPPPGMPAEVAGAKGFGVYSARFGNVYTIRQAVQLFDRAFGRFAPLESVWQQGDRFVDAFRPRIEPGGHASVAEVLHDREQHLACVRTMFLNASWLVFTLGLTEGWRSRLDGSAYPVAPGVAGGHFDPARHEFVNDSARTASDDLASFIERVREVNPNIVLLLTVSPVPLLATCEDRHVLVSTAYSKAALRVAADEAERRFDRVIYFPSYEIITSPAAGGRYYDDDLRRVTDVGVDHVMRLLSEHFLASPTRPPAQSDAPGSSSVRPVRDDEIICDQELMDRIVRASR